MLKKHMSLKHFKNKETKTMIFICDSGAFRIIFYHIFCLYDENWQKDEFFGGYNIIFSFHFWIHLDVALKVKTESDVSYLFMHAYKHTCTHTAHTHAHTRTHMDRKWVIWSNFRTKIDLTTRSDVKYRSVCCKSVKIF